MHRATADFPPRSTAKPEEAPSQSPDRMRSAQSRRSASEGCSRLIEEQAHRLPAMRVQWHSTCTNKDPGPLTIQSRTNKTWRKPRTRHSRELTTTIQTKVSSKIWLSASLCPLTRLLHRRTYRQRDLRRPSSEQSMLLQRRVKLLKCVNHPIRSKAARKF